MQDVLKKTDELVDLIIERKEYKNYQKIQEKMEQDKEIMTLIEDVKLLQKEAVKKKSKNEDVKELDKTIEEKLEMLNKIPIYQSYLEIEEEINVILQTVKNTIENHINKAIQ